MGNILSMLGGFSLCVSMRHSLIFSKAGNLRRLSTVSLHSKLPTTVYRLQLLPNSNLSAFKKDEDSDIDERLLVSDDGLVYPRVSDKFPKTNGPIFMPNTILMQDLTRLAFDQYLEEEETRKPVLISLKKGTLLPAPLIAFSFDPSKFSLQSLHPLELSSELLSLNSRLTAYSFCRTEHHPRRALFD